MGVVLLEYRTGSKCFSWTVSFENSKRFAPKPSNKDIKTGILINRIDFHCLIQAGSIQNRTYRGVLLATFIVCAHVKLQF